MQSQVFAISHTENMILAKIDASDSAYIEYIKSYIQKNFSFFIYLKDSILVFPKKHDVTKRRFFLSCLLNNLNKTREKKQSIDFNLSVPCFIEFAHTHTFGASARIVVKCHRDNVFFRFSYETLAFIEALRKNFRSIDVDYSQNVAKVPIRDKAAYTALRKMLAKNVSLGSDARAKFTYNEEELIRLHRRTSSGDFFVGQANGQQMNQWYARLCSKPEDSFEEIKKRYIRLIKTYHPDKVYGQSEAVIARYADEFRSIQFAFEQIKKYRLSVQRHSA